MKQLIFISLFISLLFFGCDTDSGYTKVTGTFSGTFSRGALSANVNIIFTDTTFLGFSDVVEFPAIGQGKYTQNNLVLDFSNISLWSDQVDKTLILSGKYLYRYDGTKLTFRKQGASTSDFFDLKKL